MARSHKIYALVCPFTHHVRYVGQTKCTLRARYHMHCNWSYNPRRIMGAWQFSLWLRGALSVPIILETLPELSKSDIEQRELDWVERLTQTGKPLLNYVTWGPSVIAAGVPHGTAEAYLESASQLMGSHWTREDVAFVADAESRYKPLDLFYRSTEMELTKMLTEAMDRHRSVPGWSILEATNRGKK